MHENSLNAKLKKKNTLTGRTLLLFMLRDLSTAYRGVIRVVCSSEWQIVPVYFEV